MKATHSDKEFFSKGMTVILNPGQFVTGRDALSKETGIHSSKIERILKTFEIEQQIEQQKSNAGRLISILSWCKYQLNEQQIEQPVNNGRTTDEQPVNTIKNDKNDKNVKKNTFLSFDNDESKLYNSFIESVDKSDSNKVFLALKGFINEHKPKYPNPYVDLWNLFAQKYGLSKIIKLSTKRLNKLKLRLNDDSFDFPAIMLKISKSPFHKGEGGTWKVDFDYIIENDNNFLKILELAS
jgi:hypothetical protein